MPLRYALGPILQTVVDGRRASRFKDFAFICTHHVYLLTAIIFLSRSLDLDLSTSAISNLPMPTFWWKKEPKSTIRFPKPPKPRRGAHGGILRGSMIMILPSESYYLRYNPMCLYCVCVHGVLWCCCILRTQAHARKHSPVIIYFMPTLSNWPSL